MKDSIEYRSGVEWNVLYTGEGRAEEPVSARIIDIDGKERASIVPEDQGAGFRLTLEGDDYGSYDFFDEALDRANETIYAMPPWDQEGYIIRELTGKEGIFHAGEADGKRYIVNAFWSGVEPGYVNHGVFALGEDNRLEIITSGFSNGYLTTEDCVRDLVADFVPIEHPTIQFVAYCNQEFDTAAEYHEALEEGHLDEPVTVPVWDAETVEREPYQVSDDERFLDDTYWDGRGKYQNIADLANEKMPNIGYTSNPDMNLFTAMTQLYNDLYNNGSCNIPHSYMTAVKEHILPVFPDFDVQRFIDEDHDYAEQQMDRVMEHLGGKSLDYPEYVAWFNSGDKLVCKGDPGERNGWSKVVFGDEKERDQWVDRRVANLGEREVPAGPDTFYFSFGTASYFPHHRGWVEVRAANRAEACSKFASHYPLRDGLLNCSFVYNANEWKDTVMAAGISGEVCHRVIDSWGPYGRPAEQGKPFDQRFAEAVDKALESFQDKSGWKGLSAKDAIVEFSRFLKEGREPTLGDLMKEAKDKAAEKNAERAAADVHRGKSEIER